MARYLGAVFLGGWLAASLASAQEVTDQSHRTTVPSSVHLFNYGDFDKKCIAWTDGCRICTRHTCSNIGIACQPKDTVTCTASHNSSQENLPR